MINIPPPPPPQKGKLLDAVISNNIYNVKSLLQQGADVNERDNNGSTVLSRAAAAGSFDIVALLVEKKANLDSRNTHGDTPLMAAITASTYPNKDAIVRLLLDKGANIDIKNNDGDTALSIALKKKDRPQVVSMLKEAAATRQRLAEEFARVAEAKRRAEVAEKQQLLREKAKSKPKLGPAPPKAA